MHLDIVTPSKQLFTGEIDLIQVPGSKGSFEVLKNHAPIISTLEKGKIKIITSEKQEEIFIKVTGGLIEVKNNEIVVLAETR